MPRLAVHANGRTGRHRRANGSSPLPSSRKPKKRPRLRLASNANDLFLYQAITEVGGGDEGRSNPPSEPSRLPRLGPTIIYMTGKIERC